MISPEPVAQRYPSGLTFSTATADTVVAGAMEQDRQIQRVGFAHEGQIQRLHITRQQYIQRLEAGRRAEIGFSEVLQGHSQERLVAEESRIQAMHLMSRVVDILKRPADPNDTQREGDLLTSGQYAQLDEESRHFLTSEGKRKRQRKKRQERGRHSNQAHQDPQDDGWHSYRHSGRRNDHDGGWHSDHDQGRHSDRDHGWHSDYDGGFHSDRDWASPPPEVGSDYSDHSRSRSRPPLERGARAETSGDRPQLRAQLRPRQSKSNHDRDRTKKKHKSRDKHRASQRQ